MTNTKQKEVWKTYQKNPWIEASNLGRIRTKDRYVSNGKNRKRLVKGRILKQWDNGRGYMLVHPHINGKTINLLVHRIVAICFIPNPLGLPEVNHIDDDPTNNAVSNLEWCSHKYNMRYKEKYGKSAAEACGSPVISVNLETGKVLRFESQHEASRQLGVSQSQISRVVKGELNQAGGYLFTKNESEITEEKIQEIKTKMEFRGYVIAINIETSEVFLFKTQTEAVRNLGVSAGNVCSVLKGVLEKTKDYWFCYSDEHAVEKVRAKFGDEVACEVEKLIL